MKLAIFFVSISLIVAAILAQTENKCVLECKAAEKSCRVFAFKTSISLTQSCQQEFNRCFAHCTKSYDPII